MDWVLLNKDAYFFGMTLGTWIQAETGQTINDYVRCMQNTEWGGQVELLAFCRLFKLDVLVFKRSFEDLAFPFQLYRRFEAAGGKGIGGSALVLILSVTQSEISLP